MTTTPPSANGSVDLFGEAISPMEKSTADPSLKSDRKTSETSSKSTSLPALADGATPSGSPDGKIQGQSGQSHVPANRFRAQGSAAVMQMSDISGPLFTTSSISAALQERLASRLQALMAVNGSPEFVLTWKTWDMPSGLPICAVRASARRTLDKDFTGWPTPRTVTGGAESADRKQELGRLESGGGDLQAAAMTAGWSTPKASESKTGRDRTNTKMGNTIVGQLPSCAATESGGASLPTIKANLNPAFSLWLQSYGVRWLFACPAVRPKAAKTKPTITIDALPCPAPATPSTQD